MPEPVTSTERREGLRIVDHQPAGEAVPIQNNLRPGDYNGMIDNINDSHNTNDVRTQRHFAADPSLRLPPLPSPPSG